MSVRPVTSKHVGGASPADLTPDDIVAVSDVLEPPARPIVLALAALVALLATVVVAFAGFGTPDRTRSSSPAKRRWPAPTSPRTEPWRSTSNPIQLDVTAGLPAGTTEARLGFSLLGVPLIGSSTEPLVPTDTGARAELDANANRFLAAGTVQGNLEFLADDGSVVATHEFAVERKGSSFPTLPGILTIVVTLVLLAYAESVLRPLRRRARRRVTGTIALTVVGAGLGVVAHAYAWLLGSSELTVPGLVVCAAGGAVAGLLAALTAIQAGRRGRVMRALQDKELQRLFARAS